MMAKVEATAQINHNRLFIYIFYFFFLVLRQNVSTKLIWIFDVTEHINQFLKMRMKSKFKATVSCVCSLDRINKYCAHGRRNKGRCLSQSFHNNFPIIEHSTANPQIWSFPSNIMMRLKMDYFRQKMVKFLAVWC